MTGVSDCFSHSTKLAVRLTQPAVLWVSGVLPPRTEQPERKANDPSPSSCAKVKKVPSPTRKETNYVQRPNSNFCKALKNNSEGCPSNQVSTAAMTSALDEKWRPFQLFFQSGRTKDLSAPL